MARRLFPLLSLAIGCAPARGSPPGAEEHVAAMRQAFDSRESVLLDFELDGTLLADTQDPAAVRALVGAQLMYAVGPLNAERAVGRYERLEVSAITAAPAGSAFEIRYHAKLPVAWGAPPAPAAYSLTLPARVGKADQAAFAAKYWTTCADAAGDVDAGEMFLLFRPRRASCSLDPSDVVVVPAKVSPSSENTSGKYPEYHRIWEDGALDVVAVFSRVTDAPDPFDEGVRAFQDFVVATEAFLHARQPDATKRTAESPAAWSERRGATLPDGRAVHVDVALVGARLAAESAAFDAWYDALTPRADVIVYSGHAGLGANVRALMEKGTFVPRKYVVWVVNGCDTFAYVDRTLADRRARVNPDDPGGTKYMDTVSNVMPAYFTTGAWTSSSFVEAMVRSRDPRPAPKTYREIFTAIDPDQVVAVTGEEDNVFEPSMFPPAAAPRAETPAPSSADGRPSAAGSRRDDEPPPASGGERGCSAGRTTDDAPGSTAIALVIAAALRRRRRMP